MCANRGHRDSVVVISETVQAEALGTRRKMGEPYLFLLDIFCLFAYVT